MSLTAIRARIPTLKTSPATKSSGMWRHGFLVQSLRFTRTRIGLGLVGIVVATAAFGWIFAPHSPVVFVGAPFGPPSGTAALGTDYIGRDILSRFLDGGHTILLIGLLGTILGVGSGTIVGLAAGYSMHRLDEILMRTVDLMLAFPGIVLALLLITVIGPHNWVLVLVVGVTFLPHTARVARGATVAQRESDFVKYAEATGMSVWRILTREILPNIAAPLTVEFGLRLTRAIGLIAALDYLGLGVQPPTPDWGLMIQENQPGLVIAPLAVILPVAAIALLTIGANLVTDGIGHAVAGSDRSVGEQ